MKRILITGANGYLGGHLARHLKQNGFDVITAGRRGCDVLFDLRAPAWPEGLKIDAVIHAAWDLSSTHVQDLNKINVDGSRLLFKLAAEKAARMIFISSASAFKGAQSNYGRTKFALEQDVTAQGGISIRPGLVYGGAGGGIVQSLNNLVKRLPVLPLIDNGNQLLYPCHIEDLAHFVHWVVERADTLKHSVYTAASQSPLTFKSVLTLLAQKEGRMPKFIPVPFPLLYLPLKWAESCGVSLGAKSDSLVSLLRQNPSLDFDSIREWPGQFRPSLEL